MRSWIVSLVAMGCLTSAAVSSAEPSETDRSLAQSLFEQGKGLMDAGNFEQACPKLAESQRLDPGGGTLLNLALCHEQQGKIATAWTEFKEALSAARRDGREERIAAAEEHIAALEPKLPWLTLTVLAPADGEEVTLDGAVIGQAAWGAPVSIDPGTHELGASAPGKKPWTGSVTIAIAEKKAASIPQLAQASIQKPTPAPVAVKPGPVRPPPTERDRGSGGGGSTLGWVIGGAGVVALGVGTFFGIQTLSKKKDSDELCPTDTTCSKEGTQLNDQAHTAAWISNIGIGLGVVGVGVGTYLVLSAGGSDERQVSVTGTW